MRFFWIFGIFPILLASKYNLTQYGSTVEYSDYINSLHDLYKELFKKRNYIKISPVFERMPKNWTGSETPRFNVHVDFAYIKIFSLDAESQIISMCLETILYWQDLRLTWDPQEFGGIEKLWTNFADVWIPENEIGNCKTLDLIYPDEARQVVVNSNGIISMANIHFVEMSCQIDVVYFPFDQQICNISFMAFSYDAQYTSMTGEIDKYLMYDDAGNGEWTVKNITIYIPTWGDGLDEMQGLVFQVFLRRVPNFYIYVIALPCFILTLLGVIGMFWTPNTVEEQLAKLGIGLTSLISMTMMIDMVSQAIPKTDRFPLLGFYVVICVVITSIACVAVVAFTTEEDKECRANPKIFHAAEEKTKSWWKQLWSTLSQNHVILQLLFQALNLLAFLVLMSFWR